MATTIITKYGVSPGVPPLPSELAVGEVAVNHGDGKMYTKKADGTVIPLAEGGGDPGELPTGVDGNMLVNVAGSWAVPSDLFYKDNPDKPGQRELQLLNQRQFTQYYGADDTEPAFEIIGDTIDEAGLRIFQPGNPNVFGIEIETDSANSSSILMRQPGTSTNAIKLETSTPGQTYISIQGPLLSYEGTSFFAGIIMDGTNAGINMQNLHRVFNHPDPTTADGTNVANARWVNNNYLSKTDTTVVKTSGDQTIGGVKTWTGEQYHTTNIRLTNGSIVMSNGSVQLQTTTGSNTAQTKAYIDAGDSDIRLKTNFEDLQEGTLDKLMAVKPFLYDWNGTLPRKREWHVRRYGVSAQEVQDLFPDVVHHLATDRDDDGESISGEHYLGLDYGELVPILIKAIQELNAKVEAL